MNGMMQLILHQTMKNRMNLSILRTLNNWARGPDSALLMVVVLMMHITQLIGYDRHHYPTVLLDNKLYLAPLKKVLDLTECPEIGACIVLSSRVLQAAALLRHRLSSLPMPWTCCWIERPSLPEEHLAARYLLLPRGACA